MSIHDLLNGLSKATVTDKEDNEHVQLHPKQLVKRLRELGTVDVDLRIKIERDATGGPGRNKVDFYIVKSSKDDLTGDDEPEVHHTATDVSSDVELEEIK